MDAKTEAEQLLLEEVKKKAPDLAARLQIHQMTFSGTTKAKKKKK
jgi:hypothetical protein